MIFKFEFDEYSKGLNVRDVESVFEIHEAAEKALMTWCEENCFNEYKLHDPSQNNHFDIFLEIDDINEALLFKMKWVWQLNDKDVW